MANENLDYVCSVFSWIENQSGRNAKIEGLKSLKNAGGEIEYIAKSLLSVALDWYRIFRLGTLPDLQESNCGKNPHKSIIEFLNLVQELETGDYLKQYGRDVNRIMDVLEGFNEATAGWLRRCLLKRLDNGVQSTTVNKVWPGLIRTFECQLADTVSDLDALRYPLLLEPKIDGVRALCFITKEGVSFMSRGGQVLSNVDHIGEEVKRLLLKTHHPDRLGLVLDGELFNGNLHSTLSVVRSSVKSPDRSLLEKVKFNVFDSIGINSWHAQQCDMPQAMRTLFVQQALQGSDLVVPVPSREIKTSADVESQYNLALAEGYEGVMLKSVGGLYSFGRSDSWLKYKPHEVDVFEIANFYEGEGRLSGMLGGFTVKMKNGDTCRVGGGFSDSQRSSYFENPTALIGKKIQVKYKEGSKEGKLREPVFLGFSDDCD